MGRAVPWVQPLSTIGVVKGRLEPSGTSPLMGVTLFVRPSLGKHIGLVIIAPAPSVQHVHLSMPVSETTFSRQAVAERILKGENLIVYRDQLLKIPTTWLEKHPGGSLALLHFVGRNATDEIDAFHSEETTALINKYAIGVVKNWEPLLPPVESGWVYQNNTWSSESVQYRPERTEILLVEKHPKYTSEPAPTMSSITPAPTTLSFEVQAKHSEAYMRLQQRITQAGLYQCRYLTGYGPEVVRYLLLGALSYFFYQRSWFMTSALFLGLMWHQLMFFVHDLGHRGVTHDWTIDRLIAILVADFIGGLSVGWWVDVSPSSAS